RAGIKAGDRILKVEGEPTKKMTLMEAVKKMRGPKGTKVTITIMREGFEEPKDFTIVRDIIRIKSVKSRMLEDGVGYVRIRTFHKTTSKELDRALDTLREKGMKALVLDLRNNPGGLLRQAVEVADAFLDEGSLVVYTKGRLRNQNLRFPTSKGGLLEVPMVVLVNGGSASASEIVSGALQDLGRAVILGTKTFGKGSVQSIVPLSDGSGLRLTTAHYYTPKDRLIQGKGITPDIIVPMPEHALARRPALPSPGEAREKGPAPPVLGGDQDPQLRRAVEILKSWDIFKKGASRGALPKAS
ncbi:MAG: S41 family peptidase, partial [Nitrospinota bacterium]